MNANSGVTQRGAQAIALDAAGNITDDGQYQYVYNSAGRLAQVLQNTTIIATYTYNAKGQRTRKVTAQGTTLYHYDLAGQLLSETTASGETLRDYVWVDTQPLAQIDVTPAGDSVVYLHTDHLGTPRTGTDSAGTVVWSWQGDAFGTLLPHEDPDGDGNLTTVNLRFPGMYADSESVWGAKIPSVIETIDVCD